MECANLSSSRLYNFFLLAMCTFPSKRPTIWEVGKEVTFYKTSKSARFSKPLEKKLLKNTSVYPYLVPEFSQLLEMEKC